MGQPVVHFEIIGPEPERLRGFYGDLFGWEFDTSSPVSAATGWASPVPASHDLGKALMVRWR
jgi:predicted enzyme related to lactoylglutathione lyase